ncbi:TetR/AcrR family transcriptional regulator [Saccharothrix coeruleofusca]|uniref:TetR family transcriptional regulator n=1 Tax=Saccharothrix coeruleofusca TaxID=33919 RepID=A0A918EC29_9PSEU|nr:TetR/AcrR family transcriptional regulator [Saccharothrix coeruleofusca]MBP2333835.1 AcrR family transcriptional regulator [Saccharothrix coeruleofusca]GGP45472.1 TetR family transcriptional regulator [Saccharothrix coeruleofusca]
MGRTKDPAVRTLLIERAAQMLRTREPITLRSLVAGTCVSTMAVYTHFGSMDGMWKALRQEGFTRLAVGFAAVETSEDPVQDLATLVIAYLRNALENPDLYRVMFDANFELEDAQAADDTLDYLVRAVVRGQEAGRFRADVVARDLATQSWAIAHGLASLVATGPLSSEAFDHCPAMLIALLVSAGDEPDRCRASVDAACARSAPLA